MTAYQNGNVSKDDLDRLLARVDPAIRDCVEGLQFQIQRLADIGYALSAERSLPKLLNIIIEESMRITNADGGTLYLSTEDNRIRFEIMKTRSLGTDVGGISKTPVPETIYPVKLYDPEGNPNTHNVSAYVALSGTTLNIPESYDK